MTATGTLQFPSGPALRRLLRMAGTLLYGEPVDPASLALPIVEARGPDRPDEALARRLTDSFHRAMAAAGSSGDGLWEIMGAMFHGPFLDMVRARDHAAIAAELAGLFYSPVSTGIAHRQAAVEDLRVDGEQRLLTADSIAALGMALGLAPVPNPEVALPASTLTFDHADLLERIAAHLDYDLAPPQAGGIFGVEFRGNLVPRKHLYQVYAANQIRAIAQRPVDSVLEIGGGVGFLAYATLKMGVARDYCIIDLPLVNMLQGYLLLKSDLAPHVELFGEASTAAPGGKRIRILPDVAIGELPEKSFDVAVNQDSFPEMRVETMEDYLDHILRLTRGHFLSINHESRHTVAAGFTHGWVHDAAGKRPGFNLRSRARYWMRPGYVEELFEIRP